MKNRVLWILGLGLTALACSSGGMAPPRSNPPASTDETPVDAAPSPTGREPSVAPDADVTADALAAGDAAAPEDSTVVTPTTPPDSAPPDSGPSAPDPTGPRGPFTCSLVIGIQATGDWFNGGFEKIVDNNRWELMAVHSGFIDYWADPKDKIWGSKPSSACATNADNP